MQYLKMILEASTSPRRKVLVLRGVTADVAPRDAEHVDKQLCANVAAETGSGSGPGKALLRGKSGR